MPLKLRPTGLGCWDRQGPPGLHASTVTEWEGRPYLSDPWRVPYQSALVLVDDRQKSDDALGLLNFLEEAKARFQTKLGRLEGVGEAGRGTANPAYECIPPPSGDCWPSISSPGFSAALPREYSSTNSLSTDERLPVLAVRAFLTQRPLRKT